PDRNPSGRRRSGIYTPAKRHAPHSHRVAGPSGDEPMKPDFTKIAWTTPEQIPIKDFYTAADLAGMEHLEYAAGLPPFLRGPYSAMYAMQPWTIRQYAGFSTAEESNAF